MQRKKNPQSVTYTDDTYSVEIPATDAEENVGSNRWIKK